MIDLQNWIFLESPVIPSLLFFAFGHNRHSSPLQQSVVETEVEAEVISTLISHQPNGAVEQKRVKDTCRQDRTSNLIYHEPTTQQTRTLLLVSVTHLDISDSLINASFLYSICWVISSSSDVFKSVVHTLYALHSSLFSGL